MKSAHNIKKIILCSLMLFISCDVSLLFAAENNLDRQQLQQLAQLQQLQSFTPTQINPTQNIPAAPNFSPSNFSPSNFSPNLPPAQAAQIQQSLQQITGQAMQLPPPPVAAGPGPASPDQTQTLVPNLVSAAPAPQAPLAPPPGISEDLSDAAFKDVTRSTLPMSPEQIMRLRQLFNSSQQAASATPGTPPRPTATSQYVNLAPGTTPPVIRLAQGFVTSLVFIDSTGAPWPLDSYDIGNPSAFNIQWNKSDNILMIQSQSLYTYGNLAVRLKNLVTPVMLTLIPGQKAVDYRVDLRVQGIGPNAQSSPGGRDIPSGANLMLLNVLDGVPPEGSRALKLTGGEGQAWISGDTLFLRTRYAVLSPGWMSTLSSADGMKAYEMMRTPMVLVSDHGKAVQLKLEGF